MKHIIILVLNQIDGGSKLCGCHDNKAEQGMYEI